MSVFAELIKTILGRRDITSSHETNGMAIATQRVLDARVAGTQFEIPHHPRVEPLTVKSVLQKRPSGLHYVRADATSLEALKLMAEHDIGAVLVMDVGRCVGIFSERDYARGSVREARPATAISVREVMTLCNTSVNLTDPAQICLGKMFDYHLRFLPVRDEDKLVAVLAYDDLLSDMVAYLARVFKENELDQQVVFLRGTYSC